MCSLFHDFLIVDFFAEIKIWMHDISLSANEPPHDKTNKMTCAPNKDSDQPGYPEPLLCTQWVAKDPTFLHADSEDCDQTGRMPRLI